MARPTTLGERFVLRILWLFGQVGLGRALTRFYLWMLHKGSQSAMGLVFKGYEPSAADVFVCTYSKSGTNWMLQIVTQIADHGEASFDDIQDLVPWPEAPVPSQVAPLETPPSSATGLRAIKTHVDAGFVPYSEDARYIVVLRDPKDVFVSSYHFVHGIISGIWGAPPSLDDWFARFVERRFPLGSWAAHTASWWALCDRPNVHVVTFAELEADLPGQVRAIADWLGIELTDDQLANVIDKSSFEWMKAHAELFPTPVPSFTKRAVLLRAGKQVAAGELLSEDQLARIDQVCREDLATLGCDLPYEALTG